MKFGLFLLCKRSWKNKLKRANRMENLSEEQINRVKQSLSIVIDFLQYQKEKV